MKRNLRSRLGHIRQSLRSGKTDSLPGQRSLSAGSASAGENGETWGLPPDWSELAPCLWARTASMKLEGTFPPGAVQLGSLYHRLLPACAETDELVFFDLETTGLSRGAGTVAFLAAFGRFRGDEFHLRQLFLSDYPGERAFVEAALEELSASRVWVSYNGLGFDLPILETRAVLNGLRMPSASHHADILYSARLLWKKSLPNCRLGTIEKLVLALDRGDDIDGSQIPAAWFSFLERGFNPELGLAMSHNLSDIATLASMAAVIVRGGEGEPVPLADPLGHALLVLRNDEAAGLAMLKALAEKSHEKAVKLLMAHHWKLGQKKERLELALLLPDNPYGLIMKSLYHEKIAQDRKKAMECLEKVIEGIQQDDGSKAMPTEYHLTRARYNMERLERGAGQRDESASRQS